MGTKQNLGAQSPDHPEGQGIGKDPCPHRDRGGHIEEIAQNNREDKTPPRRLFLKAQKDHRQEQEIAGQLPGALEPQHKNGVGQK